jgi:hypothetical protein
MALALDPEYSHKLLRRLAVSSATASLQKEHFPSFEDPYLDDIIGFVGEAEFENSVFPTSRGSFCTGAKVRVSFTTMLMD